MTLRRMTRDDNFTAIADIFVQAWRSAYKGIVPQDYLNALTTERWSGHFSAMRHDCFLLVEGGVYVGACFYANSRMAEFAHMGEIIAIYLRPEYFGQRLGARLLQAGEDALRAQGFGEVYLWVLAENQRARHFYKKEGYTLIRESMMQDIGGVMLKEVQYRKFL